jgi:hypothetical protein
VTTTTEVRFWEVRRNRSSRASSYEVRWVVGGRGRSRTRRTKALAESFLAELRQAARRGEAFDVETGLPTSMLAATPGLTWYAFVLKFVDMKWPHAAAKTRDSMTDALATVSGALVDDHVGRPDEFLLRMALRQYALPPSARSLDWPDEVATALAWLERASLPVAELEKTRTLRLALDSMSVTLKGTAAAATTIRRKRAVLHNALEYAVDRGALSEQARPGRLEATEGGRGGGPQSRRQPSASARAADGCDVCRSA